MPSANFETRSLWDVLREAGVAVPNGVGNVYLVTSGTLSTSTPFTAAQLPLDEARLRVDSLKQAADDVSAELVTVSQNLNTIAGAIPQT